MSKSMPNMSSLESVSKAIDKVSTNSDAILDACLKDDPESRVACETSPPPT